MVRCEKGDPLSVRRDGGKRILSVFEKVLDGNAPGGGAAVASAPEAQTEAMKMRERIEDTAVMSISRFLPGDGKWKSKG